MADYPVYDPAWLDSQYNNRLHVPHYQDYLDRWERQSRATEKSLTVIKDIPYGSLHRERLDVYPSPKRQSKTLIFIHGGYWQMLDKALFHFVAGNFQARGITTVLLNYPLTPEHGIDQMVLSCRTAVQWLSHHVSEFNGDPGELYVAGHSAGGHLAAMLVTTSWKAFHPAMPLTPLKGACFISGLFNLVPIQLSYLNSVVQMDRETALRNSPVQLAPLSTCPLLLAVGEKETTAFVNQSKALYASWKNRVSNIIWLPLPDLNHYSVVDAFAERGTALHQAVCRLMEVDDSF